MDPLVGQVLAGRYELQRPIGAGGMGVVYEAVQLDLGRRVAVKVLPRGPDARDLAKLRTEVLAVAAASHANVVQLVEVRDDHDPPFFVMELLQGATLATVLRQGTMPVDRAVRIAAQILSALGAAHAAGVVHRDIKPANVFLVHTPGVGDVVKVLDFGVAKLLDGVSRATTGGLVGTPAYMAPEQLVGLAVGPATDLHAVGLCLFEMLTGTRPFDAPTEGIALRIVREPAPLLSSIRPDIPPALAQVVARALEKDPARRFSSAAMMLEALLGSASGKTAAPADKSRLGMVFVIAVLAVLVIGSLGAAGFLAYTHVEPKAAPSVTGATSEAPTASAPAATAEPAPSVTSAASTEKPTPQRPATAAKDAGAPAQDAGATPSPDGVVSTATFAISSNDAIVFKSQELARMRASGPAIVQCVSAHGAGKVRPGTQVAIAVTWLPATNKPQFAASWTSKPPTGPLPAMADCFEKVAQTWQIADGAHRRSWPLFNLK